MRMILGSIEVDDWAVTTHRDSYDVSTITVCSNRRPFFGAAVMFAAGFGGFAYAFADILYEHEFYVAGGAAFASLFLGLQIGQLKLISRDLRGSELSAAVWGHYRSLNRARREIASRMNGRVHGGRHAHHNGGQL